VFDFDAGQAGYHETRPLAAIASESTADAVGEELVPAN
jgi:hypothetical protein